MERSRVGPRVAYSALARSLFWMGGVGDGQIPFTFCHPPLLARLPSQEAISHKISLAIEQNTSEYNTHYLHSLPSRIDKVLRLLLFIYFPSFLKTIYFWQSSAITLHLIGYMDICAQCVSFLFVCRLEHFLFAFMSRSPYLPFFTVWSGLGFGLW